MTSCPTEVCKTFACISQFVFARIVSLVEFSFTAMLVWSADCSGRNGTVFLQINQHFQARPFKRHWMLKSKSWCAHRHTAGLLLTLAYTTGSQHSLGETALVPVTSLWKDESQLLGYRVLKSCDIKETTELEKKRRASNHLALKSVRDILEV